MTATTTTTFDRNDNRLAATDIDAGQVYETLLGERVEIVSVDEPGRKCVLARYPDRHPQLDEDGNETPHTARMTRYGFADAASHDGYTLVEEDAALDDHTDDTDDEDVMMDDEPETMPGEWTDDIPRCPECGAYMDRRFDGWLPIAVCTNDMNCHGVFMDDRELIDGGYFEEA